MRLNNPLVFPDGTTQATAAVGASATSGSLPYYIPGGTTVTVPVNQVAVMATVCQNDGLLVVDGLIVEV
jgi:hypothetical protein